MSMSQETVSLSELMSECQAMMEPQGAAGGHPHDFPQFDNPVFVTADRSA